MNTIEQVHAAIARVIRQRYKAEGVGFVSSSDLADAIIDEVWPAIRRALAISAAAEEYADAANLNDLQAAKAKLLQAVDAGRAVGDTE